MGKVLSMVSNPFRNFNLESRAHKVISQAKPTPAPKHKSDQLDIERLKKEYPEAYQESLRKDEKLDKHLRDVYVTSTDVNINIKQKPNPERPLPLDRSTSGYFLFGAKEPDKVPMGKVTLRSALEFITRHQNEPQTYNAKKIAEEFSLNEDTVKNILKYFRVFEVYIPQERQVKAKFAGPSIPKVQIVKQFRKKLPPAPEKAEKT